MNSVCARQLIKRSQTARDFPVSVFLMLVRKSEQLFFVTSTDNRILATSGLSLLMPVKLKPAEEETANAMKRFMIPSGS